MGLRRRVRKVVGWASVVLAAVVVGGGIYAYSYVTDSETLRTAIREGAPRFLPGCLVDTTKVRVWPFAGKVVLSTLSVRQVEGDRPLLVGMSPWVQVTYDAWAMLDGKFDLKTIEVAQPRLRLRRRKDGTWNLRNLLADPWPLPPSKTSPPVEIKNGTVELVDEGDGPDAAPSAILRDVSLNVSAGDLSGTPIRFEGTAKGDQFESLRVAGTVDRSSGRVTLSGDLAHLAISKGMAGRLPAEARPAFRKLGLTGGEADLAVRSLSYDPKAAVPIRYEASVRLRSGDWDCDKLPFPIHELAAEVAVRDGVATIERASGKNGSTAVRASGTIGLGDPEQAAFRIGLEVDDMEMDDRVRAWSLVAFRKEAPEAWSSFQPGGKIDLRVRLARGEGGGPIDWSAHVGLRDVSFTYKEFRYPLEHVSGELDCRPNWVGLHVHTMVGGKALAAEGTIDRPGPQAVVDLDFRTEALPIDGALRDAMPPDVRGVVDSFRPSGTVGGTAHFRRDPPRPGEPKGAQTLTADLELNPGCQITWTGLKYPVGDLTGRLKIRPESWTFEGMKGSHGQATITGDGRVDRLGPNQYKVGIHIHADNILFEAQLREALQPAWQKSWDTLNPIGASDVDVRIATEPGKPDRYHLEVEPRPQTRLRLKFDRIAVEGDPGGPRQIELPMEDVVGKFAFDDGVVTLRDGTFRFHNATVRFRAGEVRVFDSGQFSIKVKALQVENLRLDDNLRKPMPPVMSQFARRLDDGKSFRVKADLNLAWSGKADEPATCGWENGSVFFLDNSVQAGLPLKNIQGQADHLRGSFDGRELSLFGALQLDSVNLFDVQVTDISSPIEVKGGKARLGDIKGTLMDGAITGSVEVGLESSQKFEARLAIQGADLGAYARALPGRQDIGGLVSGRLDLVGLGADSRTIQGSGEAHVTKGDLGKLPGWARLIKLLNLAKWTKTAFDQADVWFTVRNGRTAFDPIELFGDAISLHGRGSLDVQGELDVKLRLLYSRDRWHIAGVSDLIREAEGQILVIRVTGPASSPTARVEFLPNAGEFARSLGDRAAPREPRPAAPRPARRIPLLGRRPQDGN